MDMELLRTFVHYVVDATFDKSAPGELAPKLQEAIDTQVNTVFLD